MKGKAEQTTEFIIQKVAPVFNKNGYYGTSMSDITAVTGLTKGAIYGNFKNKEDLAFAAFKYNVDNVVNLIKSKLILINSPISQLKALVDFYKNYRHHTVDIGGCPILNIGVDANHQNSELLAKVQEVIQKLQYYIERMIKQGQEVEEIKSSVDPKKYARKIFASIEGAFFMVVTMNDDCYMTEMMEHIDDIIEKDLIR